jgi:uncharacterized coiled-coil DUF342 family protein
MSVEDTISNLYNDPDLEDDEADAFVTNKIAKAQQGVDELAKNKPQMGDNILQFKAEKKQWESQIAEAQRVLDYWNGVKAQRASMKEESTEVAQPQTTPMVEAEEKYNAGEQLDAVYVIIATNKVVSAEFTQYAPDKK